MKKIVQKLKRTWRFWTPKKAERYVHNRIKKMLTETKIRYAVDSESNDIQFSFVDDQQKGYAFHLSTSSKTQLCIYVVFSIDLNPESYDRICHLSQMFNDHLAGMVVRLEMDKRRLTMYSELPLDYCHVNDEIIAERLYTMNRFSRDIVWAFDKLMHTEEQAVFVFAEMVERSREEV
jgi:predicted dithiol-disulfide oxidoreductase (DUF899 family)